MTDTSLIYIVDDNPTNLDILETMMSARGYLTQTFESGASMLSEAQNTPPDLVLLDINMPDMDGYEVCGQLKADPELQDIPVIFISAMSEIADKVKAFAAGGVDYITKPFHMDEIVVRVENQLTLLRQRRELEERVNQVQRLQNILKSFLSNSAWSSLETDFIAPDSKYEPQFEVMTVMISDVAGFTKLSEQIDPATLVATLSLYMSMVSRIVYQHHGEVDKFLGDGVFAFFRDPKDAIEAAKRIQARIVTFNQQQIARGGVQLPTRIGLATGKVLLALVGSSARREYTLLGDRVNVAARLQEIAPLGGVAIDEITYRAADEPQYVSSDTFVLKGKENLERVYILKQ